jgi:hypothetical protein
MMNKKARPRAEHMLAENSFCGLFFLLPNDGNALGVAGIPPRKLKIGKSKDDA